MSSTIRAAIYVRVSTKSQAKEDKISIPDQVRECKKFIEREKWSFTGEYIDPGITSGTLDRPGLKALFASMSGWDVVIAWDFDRFFREKRSVAGYILDTLDENKKQITSVKQPIPIYDPSTYEPRENDTPYLLRELAGFTSGMDNRRRYRTLRKGLKDKIAQGYMVHSCPYGYRICITIEKGKPIRLPRTIDPEVAPIVRRIFEMYRNGWAYSTIAKELNREGIPSPRHKSWSGSCLAEIIRNPVYCGKLRTNFQLLEHGKYHRKPIEQWTIIQGKHEPIISEDLWNEVQSIRRQRQRKSRAIGSPQLFGGILRCGFCDWAMIREGAWRGGYYICGNYRATGNCQRNHYALFRLEPEVLKYVFGVIENKCTYDNVQKNLEKDMGKDIQQTISQLEKTLADIPARLNKVFSLYEADHITKTEFVNRRTVLRELSETIRTTLTQKKKELERFHATRLSGEAFLNALRTLQNRFNERGVHEKKAALAALIDHITIKAGSFKVYFRYFPSAE